jgi:DNA-binding winged helix-turn-helix (wHTH) protein/Tfp pilus assembly protein PilF
MVGPCVLLSNEKTPKNLLYIRDTAKKKSIRFMIAGATTNKTPHRGFSFGAFSLDIDRAALLKGGRTVRLRRQSFDVLRYLVERAGRLIRKEELLEAIWGNTAVTDDSLTHCLIDIRKVLGDTQRELIRTVPRRGYIFDIPVQPLQERRSQSNVSSAIAACLVVAVTFMIATADRLSNDAGAAESPVLINADAAGLYEQARFMFNRRAPGDLETARQYYLQATRIEPDYADAWAGVAATYYIEFNESRADADKLAKVKEFAERAISIDPDNAEGRFRLARYYRLTGDDDAADRHLKHAFSMHPRNPLILSVMAGEHERQGNLDLAIEALAEAVESDPLSATYRGNLSWYLLTAGRYEEAIEQSLRAGTLKLHSAERIEIVVGLALIKLGRYQDAFDVAVAWSHTAEKYQVMAMANFGLGRESEARRAISLLKTFPEAEDSLRLAELQAYCDEIDRSFQTLTAMREQLLIESLFDEMNDKIQSIQRSPFMANIRTDGRWGPWLEETRKMMSEDLVLSFR